MGKAVAIVGKGEAKTGIGACKHLNTSTGNFDPFTNTATLTLVDNASVSVLVNSKAVILKKSQVSLSSGCVGGNGEASGMAPNGPCAMDESSATVFIENSEVVRKDDKTNNDSGNAEGQITDGSDNVFAGE